jgi:hypothetical protein
MRVSLDKVESSNPNFTAAPAGASTGETRHLQPNASNAPDAEFTSEGCCAFLRRAKSGENLGKARFASQTHRNEASTFWEKLFVVADGDFFVLTSELCSARAMHVVAMH